MTDTIVPDSEHRGLVARLPERVRDFALLARFDRPIGWWLLFWPCAWGVWLAGAGVQWQLVLWLLALCLVGLVVLFQLRWQAQLVALASLFLVACYPFMKRVTWWPQAWLGLVFTWGALVGWTALRSDRLDAMAALYIGSIFWCVGYDTIYALQDREDDALVGIRSSALRLGDNVQAGVIAFYCLALTGWGLAFWLLREDWVALAALIPAALHLMWQAFTLDPANADNPLTRFRSNRFAGLLVAAACLVVGNA